MADIWTLPQPNIRSMVVPDPGYMFVEADLSGADAQVVAWDAGAERLKQRLRDKVDLHTENSLRLYPDFPTPRHSVHINGMTHRDNAKRAVHAGNYDTTPRTLAITTSIPIATAEQFLKWWKFEENPEIGDWHQRVRWTLMRSKMPIIHNAFGFRKVYTDRPDRLLGQALAWIAQSTVALVINHALVQLDRALCEGSNWGGQLLAVTQSDPQALLQVHDSILMQVPTDTWPDIAGEVLKCMEVTVPYADPLVIPSELKYSLDNWGNMQKWTGA